MRAGWLFALIAVLLLVAAGRDGLDRWIEATELPPLVPETSVEVRDRHGDVLRAYTVADGLWRLGAGPRDVDPRYLQMLVGYEDKRFFDHAGVDPLALARAAYRSALAGRIVSGGSTLTMQVARLIEDGSTGRWAGKLRQIRVALALERQLSKDDILRLYLTHAPFGGNLEGIRAASLAWLGKEPSRLTPAQAALLIALPQSPEARRPDRSPNAARAARERVLKRLKQQGILNPETTHAALSENIPTTRRPFPLLAAHMSDRALNETPDALRHDLTLSRPLQATLERLAAESLLDKEEQLSISILVADHQTGEILASVGSPGYAHAAGRRGFVDMTSAIRSPGSTLKPLVYGLAFDLGLAHPETIINDAPVRFGTYAPQNFDGAFRGELPVSDALRQSLNIPVVLLTHEFGPAKLMSALRAAGTDPQLSAGKPGLAVALGGVGLTLGDLVAIYAMQANQGTSVSLHWNRRQTPAIGTRVLSPAAAWQVGHILSDLSPPSGAPAIRLAYKTGTSYGHRDAWAIGYDGQHVVGIWIGRPDGTPVPGAFGGELAAPVLFQAFSRLKPQIVPLGPPPPETLLLSSAQLPIPLQRFRSRDAIFAAPSQAPKLAFPPDGATLETDGNSLTVKIRDGALPLTILANGMPLATNRHHREILLAYSEKGAAILTVIDANGLSARANIWIK